jgi:hypothetical protein
MPLCVVSELQVHYPLSLAGPVLYDRNPALLLTNELNKAQVHITYIASTSTNRMRWTGRWALGAGQPRALARVTPIGPGGLQSGFSTLRYVRRDFRKKKSGPRTPRPPGGPPVLGALVWRAEGLPSTRNWPFRWPLPPTSPPQVIPKAM